MIQVLDECGLDGMARAIGIVVNEAMKIERNEALGAQPYERTDHRRGYANGFKPKTLSTRIGQVELKVPQTRGVEFYPKSLERGVRSERALKLAVVEVYVQGVSTRKISPRLPANSAGWMSPAAKSAERPNYSTKNSNPGGKDPSESLPI